MVGRYLVHDRIAAGGMATVHVGRLLGPAGFSRTVAIKRLHDGYASDPEFVAMLLDEARLAATIRHPNVVPTLDVVAERNELLVVMDYIEGDSLAHLVKLASDASAARGIGRIPLGIAVAVVAQALQGLHAAHEARDKNGERLDIVHRDVSPQNILVGVDGVARVLDFGIAKAASRATATEDGQLKGKAAYMAPEQLNHGAVDRRTDVWATAVVLWELVTGRRLFFADSPAETMGRVLRAPIDPPSRFVPDLPPNLVGIIMHGLQRDPAARFATAEQMAQALEESGRLPRAKDIGLWVADVARPTLEKRAAIVRAVERTSHPPMSAAPSAGTQLRSAIQAAENRRNAGEMPTDVGLGGPAPSSRGANQGLSVPTPVNEIVPGAPNVRGVHTIHGHAPPPRMGPGGPEVTEYATVHTSPSLALPVRRGPLFAIIGVLATLGIAGIALAAVSLTRRAPVQAATPPAPSETVAVPSPPPQPAEPSDRGARVVDSGVPMVPVVVDAPTDAPATAPSASAAGTSAAGGTKKGNGGSVNGGGGGAGKQGGKKPDTCAVPWTVDEHGMKHFKVECL